MTDPTTARLTLAGLASSTLGEPAVPAMSYPIMVDGAQMGWSASCYETARSLAVELVVARVAAADEAASLRHQLQMAASKIERVERERDEARANYAFMVERAADQRLDGYRELGAKCAALEAERDEARDDCRALSARCAALEAERDAAQASARTWSIGLDAARARLAIALDGCCPDCGGSGYGADACDGPGHHTPPCPSCEGSGLAPGARRMAAQSKLAWAERDAALARVAELEAPGECNSIHKLRAQVADLQAVVERMRPVVEVLAGACERGKPTNLYNLLIRMGRDFTPAHEDAAWFRSILPAAPESVPDLAPQLPPTLGEGEDAALRETIARLEAEMSKPVAGPWEDDGLGPTRTGYNKCAVSLWPNRWNAYSPETGDPVASGPETGDEGRRLADAAAVAAGWRLCDRA